jgi:hypothetical protein
MSPMATSLTKSAVVGLMPSVELTFADRLREGRTSE